MNGFEWRIVDELAEPMLKMLRFDLWSKVKRCIKNGLAPRALLLHTHPHTCAADTVRRGMS